MTGAPDEREPPEVTEGSAPPEADASEDAGASEAESPGSPDSETTEDELAPSSPREVLLVRLGHAEDPPSALDAYLNAQERFERGDNRAAAAALRALLDGELSPELQETVETLLRRIQPDRVALLVLFACAVGLVVIWILAIRAS